MEERVLLSFLAVWFSLTFLQLADFTTSLDCATESTPTISVRLTYNGAPNAGRVEIGYQGVWKSLCDTSWDIKEANVICKMLDYHGGAAAAIKGMTSSDVAWPSTINCDGHEADIEKCTIQNERPIRCDHKRRAGVTCVSEEHPKVAVRLVNGSTPNQGRVEVRYYGVWGTVCNDDWGLADAHVVCRMLNYSKASWAGTARVSGTGPILLDNVQCRGSEKSLAHCRTNGWVQHNCIHSEDAGVTCERLAQETLSITVRLIGGERNVGQVEVNYKGTWIPVCDDTWDILDAHVICRMLGYKGALAALKNFNIWKAGRWLGGVQCSGEENLISECYHRGWSNKLCRGNYSAGVVCQVAKDEHPDVAVRLVNGSTPNQGRVEVRYYGVWGTVCDDGWGLADAHVVCRMLNYSKASWAGTARVSGTGPILLDDVQCRGNEKSLEHCRTNGWVQHNCIHSEDAGVTCERLAQEDSSVTARLVETKQKHTGFVEIKYNGPWIPVCDDTWEILDAHVICRMLGYKGALAAMKRFGVGNDGLWMSGVACSGDETSISECTHRGWTNKLCSGNFRAGVVCKATKDLPTIQVRLEEGPSPNTGRVAVRYGNVWGTICNRGLDINDAKVICRMLGYPGASKVYIINTLLLASSPIWLMNLECNGTENSIVDCRHPGWGNTTCNHDNDVAIMCKNTEAPRFHISGTNAITDAKVEILFNDSQTVESRLKSVYQVAVEKRDNEQHFKSYEHPLPFVYNEVNITMATEMGNASYITAEILGPISDLTIGDGQYYHGYYNAPLEPGSMYRVHVRIVTMAMDGKRIYGDSAYVVFTTKVKVKVKGTYSAQSSQGTVIGLSIVIVLLILLIIGYFAWCFLRKKKENKINTTTENPDILTMTINDDTRNEAPHFNYQVLSFPPGEQQERSVNRELQHYQSLVFQAGEQTHE